VNQSELRVIIQQHELESTEFKSSLSDPDDVGQTLVAFANGLKNSPRGYLLLGVENDGSILGISDDLDAVQCRLAELCRSGCYPPFISGIYPVEIDNKTVVVVEVHKSDSRPHRYRGRCFVRVGPTTRQATLDEELRIREEVVGFPPDSLLVRNATIDDLDPQKVLDYYKASRSRDTVASDSRNIGAIIQALGLARDDNGIYRPTVAAMLVFGREPQRFLRHSSVNAIRFKGTKVAGIQLDRSELKGTLDSIIEQAASFVTKLSVAGSSIPIESIRRVDIAEYPMGAVREAVANAVVHRDYQNTGAQVDLYMFDDRIEIRSPGGLGGGVTEKDLENHTGKRWLRNPDIARLLHELRYIEEAGTGITKMFEEMEKNGSGDPRFAVDETSVLVILACHPDYSARRRFEEALFARDHGRFSEAKSIFEELLRMKPDYSEAWSALGAIDGEMGDLEAARERFRTAIDKNPDNSIAYFSWALMEDRAGELAEARRLFSEAIKRDPENPAFWHAWATMEKRVSNFPKARELYKKATEVEPNNSVNWQSWAHVEIRLTNYQEAERLLIAASGLARDSYQKAWIVSDLGYVLWLLKRPKTEIERYYKQSLELNPNDAQTNYRYSQLLRAMKRFEEADRFEREATRLGWKPHARKHTGGRRYG